jgi:hypothetical protein
MTRRYHPTPDVDRRYDVRVRSLVFAIVLVSSAAWAGGRHLFAPPVTSLRLGVWAGNQRPARPIYPVAYYPVYLWYAVPIAQVPSAPPPEPVVVEREVIREPAPVVVIVQQAPVEQPAPQAPSPAVVVPPPVPPPSAAPLPPRTPGPDVYHWTDADGVEMYSTRVPPEARGKAKKLRTLSR